MLASFEYWMWKKLIEVVHYKCHLYIHIYIYIERERERAEDRALCIYTIWDIYYESLSHWIIEAEMSHNLPNASQKSRRADDIIPVWVRIRRASGKTPNPRAEGDQCPNSAGRQDKKRGEFFLSLSFVLFGLLMDWMISTHWGRQSTLRSPPI